MNDVLTILTGTDVANPQSVIDQGFVGINATTAGCYVKTTSVYCIFSGRVIYVGTDPLMHNNFTVITEIDAHHWICYCNLSKCNISVGAEVTIRDFIGYAADGIMRLDYCTDHQSQFPVRVGVKQLYKHDPTPIIFGGYNA